MSCKEKELFEAVRSRGCLVEETAPIIDKEAYFNRITQIKDECNSVTVSLPTATNSSQILIRYSKLCMSSLFREGFSYKKCGVSLNDLSSVDAVQLDLLSAAVDPPDERLMSVIDTLNRRYGSGTIRFASEGIRQEWRMRSDLRSPRFTSRWDEILVVKS